MKILRGGCASMHDESFYLSRANGQDNHVILLLRSHGEYWIEDKQYLLSPGHAVIIAPGTRYHYSNPNGKYSDDWLHFRLEEGETLPAALCCNLPFLLDDFETCSTLIGLLLWEQAYTDPAYAVDNINALLPVLFNHMTAAMHAQENIQKAGPYLPQFKRLRLQLQHSLPEKHTIRSCADGLHISVSHFQHLYSRFFGISFQNDLIRMRISHAETLLQTTELPMEQIAQACGYSNTVHFFRQFKQLRGITPAKYRNAKFTPNP